MLQRILTISLICHLCLTNGNSQYDKALESTVEILELVKLSLGLYKIYPDIKSSWKGQLKVAVEMFAFQNDMNGSLKEAEPIQHAVDSNLLKTHHNTNADRLTENSKPYRTSEETHNVMTVFILCDQTTYTVAAEFMTTISTLRTDVYFLLYEFVNNQSLLLNIQSVIRTLEKNCNSINSILIFSDNLLYITTLLKAVNQVTDFKLTGVLHITEWIIVSTLSTDLFTHLQNSSVYVDFMTVLARSAPNDTIIAQKSRNELLSPKVIVTFRYSRCTHQASRFRQKLRHKLHFSKGLRKNGRIYLNSKTSVLSGMVLPVCLFPDGKHIFFAGVSKNITGYSLELMLHMAYRLGFTSQIVSLDGGGFYGDVNFNGTATGLTGMLKSRQIAFSTMPTSRSQTRIRAIDYLPNVINYKPLKLIYRLPNHTGHLDLVYTEIVQTDVYVLMIPLLVLALFGAVLHVAIRACTLRLPEAVSKSDVKSLLSYHEHVCFTSSSPYMGQAGRFLQASWAFTVFLLVSAYSTFLVTTFTTKPPELVINSFEKLLANKDYKVGVCEVATAFLSMMEFTNDSTERQVWEKLLDDNRTEPGTFNSSLEVHAQRVVKEKYVWITGDCASMSDVCDEYFVPLEGEIRSYKINAPDFLTNAYIGIPKNTFYKDVLYKLLLHFEEKGILKYLQSKYLSSMVLEGKKASKMNNEQTPVTLRRIQLPIYVSLAGIGLGIVVMIIELVCHLRNQYCQ